MFERMLAAAVLVACASCGASKDSGGPKDSGGQTCAPFDTSQCTAPNCYLTWSALQASAPDCNDNSGSGFRETFGACAGYDLYFTSGIDYRNVTYYDKATGALVALTGTNGAPACVPGAGGVPSAATCPTDAATTDPCAPDAGQGN